MTKYWNFSFSIRPSSEYLGWFPLRLTGLISFLSKGLSGVFSSTTFQRHQFFGILRSLQSSCHNQTCPLYVYRERLRFEVMTGHSTMQGDYESFRGRPSPSPQVVRDSSWRRHLSRHLSRAWKIKSGSASSRERRWEISHAQGTACTKRRVRRLLSSWAFGDTRAGNEVIDHSRGQVTALHAPVKS